MARSYLVLDIETVPDPTIPWDAARDGFPPAPHHQVVAVAVLWLDEDLGFKRMGVFGAAAAPTGDPEARVLADFTRFVGREHCHLVTFNGRGFDLPVLIHRCLRHGVSFHAYYHDRDYRYRYSEHGHIDLADLLTDHGAARRASLGSVSQLVGLPGALPVDGSMIAALHRDGRADEIRAHCLQDVVRTAFVFLRFELLRGRLDRHGYLERAHVLWQAALEEPRVEPVLAGADRERLLFEAQ